MGERVSGWKGGWVMGEWVDRSVINEWASAWVSGCMS